MYVNRRGTLQPRYFHASVHNGTFRAKNTFEAPILCASQCFWPPQSLVTGDKESGITVVQIKHSNSWFPKKLNPPSQGRRTWAAQRQTIVGFWPPQPPTTRSCGCGTMKHTATDKTRSSRSGFVLRSKGTCNQETMMRDHC